ncbi:hypothetical protein PGB90_001241 [Kerria lacca]
MLPLKNNNIAADSKPKGGIKGARRRSDNIGKGRVYSIRLSGGLWSEAFRRRVQFLITGQLASFGHGG